MRWNSAVEDKHVVLLCPGRCACKASEPRKHIKNEHLRQHAQDRDPLGTKHGKHPRQAELIVVNFSASSHALARKRPANATDVPPLMINRTFFAVLVLN